MSALTVDGSKARAIWSNASRAAKRKVGVDRSRGRPPPRPAPSNLTATDPRIACSATGVCRSAVGEAGQGAQRRSAERKLVVDLGEAVFVAGGVRRWPWRAAGRSTLPGPSADRARCRAQERGHRWGVKVAQKGEDQQARTCVAPNRAGKFFDCVRRILAHVGVHETEVRAC